MKSFISVVLKDHNVLFVKVFAGKKMWLVVSGIHVRFSPCVWSLRTPEICCGEPVAFWWSISVMKKSL